MSTRRGMLILLGGLIALALGWYFGPHARPGARQDAVSGALVFPQLAAALQQVDRLEISNQGKTLVLLRKNGVWGLANRGGYPAMPGKLREVLTGLTELRLLEPRTSDPANYARLGVEDPAGAQATADLLVLRDAKGAVLAELIIGHRRTRTRGNLPEMVYIRRPGQAQSWLAEGRLPIDADPQLWLARDIGNISLNDVTRVVVTRGDTKLEFTRTGDALALTDPADHPKLDEYRLEEVFRGLEALSLSDVRPEAGMTAAPVGQAAYTLADGTVVTVTVLQEDKQVWITLAATGAQAAALNKNWAGWAYQVGEWKEKAFLPTVMDLKANDTTPK